MGISRVDIQERFEPGCGAEISAAHRLVRPVVRVLDAVEASVAEHPVVTRSIVFDLAVAGPTDDEVKGKLLGRAGGFRPLPAFESPARS
ncbi:hypothetical protein ACFTWD_02705 [Streptomyces sp. NPDC056943]|uniref:hypothetical protein n=1 Tax=Streptomyces sp. NPDC056943 TaxID=3345971 RepID=UPI003627303F